MFKKVLIAEDQEIMNRSLRRTLEEMQIPSPDHAYYCEQALAKVKLAIHQQQPYDLLVTDLYFEIEGSSEQIAEGTALIKAARALLPQLKVLVFSAESRPAVIRPLFDELNIDAYVRKARGDAQELQGALERIRQGRRHYPRELRLSGSQENLHVFTDYDKTIIRLMAEGYGQKEIAEHLLASDMHPSSLRSVEKRLNIIRSSMGFSKNEQLVAFCKDMMLS